MSEAEYKQLLTKMLEMDLKAAEEPSNVDEYGMETIDLSEEAPTPEPPRRPKNMMMEATTEPREGPGPIMPDIFAPGEAMLFRKTKANNFFAEDESAEKVQPLDGGSEELEKQRQPRARQHQAKDVDEADDILKQLEKMMAARENMPSAGPPGEALPGLDDL